MATGIVGTGLISEKEIKYTPSSDSEVRRPRLRVLFPPTLSSAPPLLSTSNSIVLLLLLDDLNIEFLYVLFKSQKVGLPASEKSNEL